MATITCLSTESLQAFLVSDLAAGEEAHIAEHLAGCAACERRVLQLSDDTAARQLLVAHRRAGSAAIAEPGFGELRERLHVLGWFNSAAEAIPADATAPANQDDTAAFLPSAAEGGPAQPQPAPAIQLGKFDVLQPIGSGGFGVVYLARDRTLQRLVALKLARSSVLADPDLRIRFLREAEALARLQHPNIVPVFEAGEFEGTCYLAIAYCEGPTLEQWLRDQPRPIDPRLAARLVRTLSGAVEHAHAHGILHRDIKPSNILLDKLPSGRPGSEGDLPFVPKLTDFGLAKIAEQESQSTLSGVLLGTPQYMAPEQAAGLLERIGPPTDVYSLGVVLYELLAGRLPIRGATAVDTLRRVLIDEPAPLKHWEKGVPDDLAAIALKCLDKSPARRYPAAGALAADLERFLAGSPTLARPLGRGEWAARWIGRNRAVSTVFGLLAMVLILIGGLFLYDQRLATLHFEHGHERAALAYREDVYSAAQRYGAGDAAQTVEFLKRQIPARDMPDLRGIEW
ncbi:MAG: serine/threonine-protein kinase, partial [Pirellulaceae bacterium]